MCLFAYFSKFFLLCGTNVKSISKIKSTFKDIYLFSKNVLFYCLKITYFKNIYNLQLIIFINFIF